MPLKVVRSDITKMNTEAIVNTANEYPIVGSGCDYAVYEAAGREKLLRFRRERIGCVPEGEVFLTPGFGLPAKYIIHAVSPLYIDGAHGEEEKLRGCYRKSLQLAKEKGIASVAFPLIATGSFGYPKEEGIRIAADEINSFLLSNEMTVFLVVFDEAAAGLGRRIYPDLEAFIDANYVREANEREFGGFADTAGGRPARQSSAGRIAPEKEDVRYSRRRSPRSDELIEQKLFFSDPEESGYRLNRPRPMTAAHRKNAVPVPTESEELCCADSLEAEFDALTEDEKIEKLEKDLKERLAHTEDSFKDHLLYLIRRHGLENAEVWKNALLNKKLFSKIMTIEDYHPSKLTVLCLCMGARLNIDETRDLLRKAGFALSPCDKTDLIFGYFIEHGYYDMIELDIVLEQFDLPCIIK